MFEGRKIKKLIFELSSDQSESDRKTTLLNLEGFGKSAFPYIIQAIRLKHLDPKKIKTLLAKTCGNENVEEVVSLTGDSIDIVRNVAKNLIIKKMKDESIPLLIINLSSTNMHLKMSAKNILSEFKNEKTTISLVSLYNNAPRELKRNIISILQVSSGQTVERFLISCLKDNDPSVRLSAVKGLSTCKCIDSTPSLIEMLKDENIQVKRSTVDAISAIGEKHSIRYIIPLLKDNDLLVRQKAVDCICKNGDSDIVPDIINLLKDSDVNVRRCAVELLNSIKDPKTADELIRAIKDSDWWVREIATEALTSIKGDNIIIAMSALLADKNENIRRCAVEFFNRVTSDIALDPLIATLKDADWWVREKAVSALGKLKNQKAIKPLSNLINDDEIKWVVPKALGDIGGQDTVTVLLEFLKDDQIRTRVSALTALSKLKDRRCLEEVKHCLSDSKEEVRYQAISTLKIITGKVFKALEVRNKEIPNVKQKISNMPFTEGEILSEAILVVDLCNSTTIADKFGNQFAIKISKTLENKVYDISEKEKYNFIKGTGDGFLLTFKSVKQAVSVSLALFEDLKKYNKTAPKDEIIEIRCAINFGETRISSDGDRLGHATNITFRVEGVSPDKMIEIVGGKKKGTFSNKNCILITESAASETQKFEGIKTSLIGLFEFKGIAGLHRVFEIIPGPVNC